MKNNTETEVHDEQVGAPPRLQDVNTRLITGHDTSRLGFLQKQGSGVSRLVVVVVCPSHNGLPNKELHKQAACPIPPGGPEWFLGCLVGVLMRGLSRGPMKDTG